MNFFEHQRVARRKTRWLVLLFLLAVVLIVAGVDLVLMLAFGLSQQGLHGQSLLAVNSSLLLTGATVTVSIIALAALYRIITLNAGGGAVARNMGGTLVDADTRDLKRTRLRNVVEEMALAAGIPVPEVYVLERETGINAFASGFSTSDAAVTVTRGMLETLNREQLQGVVAHEFSHILNGDMRLNMRLIGLLFGILALAILGKKLLQGVRRSRRSRNGGAVVLIGVGITLIGYIGLFFGRWIKSAVSRQREYLADASAVQFTRNPDSIGGALKTIAVYTAGTHLQQDSEEITHMLFGEGMQNRLFATHPPILDRIRRIQPNFREAELADVERRLQRQLASNLETATQESSASETPLPGEMIDLIGNPDLQRLLQAAMLIAAIPNELVDAAHSVEWAPALLLYALLDDERSVYYKQLEIISREMGIETESQVRFLASSQQHLESIQRLPLFELAFPSLKRRPVDELERINRVIDSLIKADNAIDTFEYLLARLIQQHLNELANPSEVVLYGNKSLQQLHIQATQVLSILAQHGEKTQASDPASAFSAGAEAMQLASAMFKQADNWQQALDRDLPGLNLLAPAAKQQLVHGLLACVLHDGKAIPVELELLRALCGAIHVPMPLNLPT